MVIYNKGMGNGVTLSVLSKDNPSSTAVKLKAN